MNYQEYTTQQLENMLSGIKKQTRVLQSTEDSAKNKSKKKMHDLNVRCELLKTENYLLEHSSKLQEVKKPFQRVHLTERQTKTEETSLKVDFINGISQIPIQYLVAAVAMLIAALFAMYGCGWATIFEEPVKLKEISEAISDIKRFFSYFGYEHTPGGFLVFVSKCGFIIPVMYAIHLYMLISQGDYKNWQVYTFVVSIAYVVLFMIASASITTKHLPEEIPFVGFGIGEVFVVVLAFLQFFLIGEPESKAVSDEIYRMYQIPVMNYYPATPVRVLELESVANNNSKQLGFKILLKNYLEQELKSVVLTIDLVTDFGEVYRVENCRLTNFISKLGVLYSENIYCAAQGLDIGKIESVNVYLEKYVLATGNFDPDDISIKREVEPAYIEQLKKKTDYVDIVCKAEIIDDYWRCVCGNMNDLAGDTCGLCKKKRVFAGL